MPTLGEFAHDVSRGLFKGMFRLIGRVVFLAITIVAVVFAAKHHVAQEAEAEQARRADNAMMTNRPSAYTQPPSSQDGWGEAAIERSD